MLERLPKEIIALICEYMDEEDIIRIQLSKWKVTVLRANCWSQHRSRGGTAYKSHLYGDHFVVI